MSELSPVTVIGRVSVSHIPDQCLDPALGVTRCHVQCDVTQECLDPALGVHNSVTAVLLGRLSSLLDKQCSALASLVTCH